jgi:hypothetical protein
MVGGFQLFCDCFRVFDIFMMTPALLLLFFTPLILSRSRRHPASERTSHKRRENANSDLEQRFVSYSLPAFI